jgi:hypothetical protein
MTSDLIDIAAKISTLDEFSHVESPLILRICEAYEAAMQPALAVDEELLGAVVDEIIAMEVKHIYDSRTPLKTKICAILRPYLTQSVKPDVTDIDVGEWQPIETAPRDGVFLVMFNGTADIARNREDAETSKRWFWLGCNGSVPIDELSHWMPLPPPPTNVPVEGE